MGLPSNILMIKILILMLKPRSRDSLTPTLCYSVGPISVNFLCNVGISSFYRVLVVTCRSEQLLYLRSS